MRSTIKLFVPFACVAMGLLVLVVGCEKRQSAEEVIPANSPEAYMKDPVFRAKLEAMELEQKKIINERQPLLKRLKELSPDGKSVREENMAEFKKLRARVDALNARYEKIRQEQLATLRERMTPENLKAKRLAKQQKAAADGNAKAAKEISK